MSKDTIYRQDAIDALEKAIRKNPYYDSNERINGLGVYDVRVVINDLPSADIDLSGFCDRLWRCAYERGKEEAVIRCKDCTYADGEMCTRLYLDRVNPEDFCSWAGRRSGDDR